MAGSIQRNPDGSIALFIRDDLQFDSSDERIYHETLTLPALALTEKRQHGQLRVLVIGGGDGLVARELLKSSRVSTIDLVDYDQQIVTFAQTDFVEINQGSLLDGRVSVHIMDAWDFVESAVGNDTHYDLIVSDLTVPEDMLSARFHSVEWYSKLAQLLTEQGVLSVNAVSPQAMPEAFWSVFNSIVKGHLQAYPYHVTLPSFAAQGYGDDWGFFIASKQSLRYRELDDLPLAEPRHYLQNCIQLIRLFEFPQELFAYQEVSLPALAGSTILLHYFQNSKGLTATTGDIRNSLSLEPWSLTIPEPDDGKSILPPELSAVLAKSISTEVQAQASDEKTAQMFLYSVLDLMPSLNREHTKEIIEDFLKQPESFLQALDLPGLVTRLLQRAGELPARLVRELELLQDKLHDWTGDSMSLLNLTERVVTIIILVIVVGNLLYPDAVYGKGEHHAAASHHAAGASSRHAAGARRGVGRAGGTYWNGTNWVNRPYNTRTINNTRVIKNVPVPSGTKINYAPPTVVPGATPAESDQLSSSEYVDVFGKVYPARYFRIDLSYLNNKTKPAGIFSWLQLEPVAEATDCYAAYRLGPGADILPTGHLVMPLTNLSYLLVSSCGIHLMDQRTGTSTLHLGHDSSLLATLIAEIDRQKDEVTTEFTSANYLNAAKDILASIDSASITNWTPLADQTELFPSAWIAASGKYIALKRNSGEIAYLDGDWWYSDEGVSPLRGPYPSEAKRHIVSYVTKIVREAESTRNKLLRDKGEADTHLAMLTNELESYKSSNHDDVKFGSHYLAKAEAIRLSELAIKKTANEIALCDQCMAQLPSQIEQAKITLENLSSETA